MDFEHMLTQLVNLTDKEIETLQAEAEKEEKRREVKRFKIAQDKAVKALKKYFELGGELAYTESYYIDEEVAITTCKTEDEEYKKIYVDSIIEG